METLGRDEVVKAAFRYRDALMGYAFALLRDWSQAEDVVQDAFIVVMNRWSDFRPGTSLFCWVREIVRHKAQEARRARMRQASPLDEALLIQVTETLDGHFDEEAAERQSLMHRALERCMSFLNARAVEILAGFYGRSESCEAIAERQKRSVNAIRLSLSRVRKQLQECMTRQLPLLEGGP
ncbi:MAG TPA: sigma-70 family RNA polymerase sigma factor [Planctomycetota bacterium]|nr:sigma-70 family RNA polymerase sigma factor [Planctomycetota bacterium]